MKKRERGQALVIITICLIALLGLLALVLDTGKIYIEHAKLQKAVDAGALAAAQELPENHTSAKEDAIRLGTKTFELNGFSPDIIDSFQFAPPLGEDKDNTVLITAHKRVETRMAQFLGYSEWTIWTQSAARSGPVSTIKNWIPIGILDDSNQGVELYRHYRLTNTTHTVANSQDIKLTYKVLQVSGNLRSEIRDTISSKKAISQQLDLKKPVGLTEMQNICRGIDDRVKTKWPNVKGCFEVGEDINLNSTDYNVIGPGVRKDWYYGDDPRLVYIPFVEQTDPNYVTVKGFGLFYIEYAHFDGNALGTTEPMTEIVGYFVRSIVEGPVKDTSVNYGVLGIEYVDLNKLNMP